LRTRCYATRSIAASAGSTSGPLEAPARTSSGVATSERCSGSGESTTPHSGEQAGPTTNAPPARSGTQLCCRQRAPARGGSWNRGRSYRTRRAIRIRARARGGGVRGRPSWAPCDGAGGQRQGRRAFAAAATALAAPPLSSPWTAPPSPPKQLSSPTPNACPDGQN